MRSFTTYFILAFTSVFTLLNAQVVINEFMSSNNETIEDEDGDSSDWIEIFNTGNEPVSLEDYYLSDDENSLHKWSFPAIEIDAQSYLLIFCSNKNRRAIDMPLHTNFKINASGEDLFLVINNDISQHFAPIQLTEDVAYAAFPNGDQQFFNTIDPSPEQANRLSIGINYSLPSGFYTQDIQIHLSHNIIGLEDIEIRYTLNGDLPRETDSIYLQNIQIQDQSDIENILANIPTTPDYSNWEGRNYYPAWIAPDNNQPKGTSVRAAAFLDGQQISKVFTHTYFVFTDNTIRFFAPVVSIVCPQDSLFSNENGIYVPGNTLEADNMACSGNSFREGRAWERTANLEYFVEGENVINQLVGIRIHGGKTRGAAQKTLKIYARSDYGKKRLDYPFFNQKEQSSYKRLLLKTTIGSWTGSIISDAFAHQAVRDLNLDIQEYQAVIVFINGEYWGVHELREKFDRYKIAEDNNLDKDSIIIHASYGNVIEGEKDNDFFVFRDQYLPQNDITDSEVYAYVKTKIDIDNIIDYFFAELYFNNRDWPANNSKMWRSPQFDNKWRWIYYDIDGGMGEDYIGDTMLPEILEDENYRGQDSWSTIIIRTLIQNEDFKNQFLNRAKFLLQHQLNPDTLYQLAKDIEMDYQIDMPLHFDRWQGWLTPSMWQHNVNVHLKKFVLLRACEMEVQIMDFFNINSFLDCEEENQNDISVYPNPAHDFVNITLDAKTETLYQYHIYNQLGQLIDNQHIILSTNLKTININKLSSGVYYLCLFDIKMNKIAMKTIVKI